MKKISKFIYGGILLGAVALTGCENAEYDQLTNQAYILQTATNANSSQKLTVGNEFVSTDINVRLSEKATEANSFKLVYDAQALEQFNSKNETSYTALPEGSFSLSANEVTIEPGTSVSNPATLTINPYNDELKNSGKKYALAFRLEKVSGNANVLKSGSVMVFVLDQVVIQPVVQFNVNCYVGQDLKETYTTTEWTMEMNIKKDILGTQIGQYNNQAIYSTGPDEVYVRFGDAPIEGNRLQIKTQGTQMNSQTLFNANTWYHIAYVCTGAKLYLYVNGQLDNSMDMPGKETRVSAVSISSNSSYNRGNSYYSEVRLWKKARSQKEIQNNMYSCDPATPGFIFYYKFNEGQGYQFKDWSGNGNDATTKDNTTPVWIQDVRIDGK